MSSERSPESAPQRSRCILVVDDEPDVRFLFSRRYRRRIRSGELILHFASDGEDALRELGRHPTVDAVVTDIHMPKMDGLELLRRVKADFPGLRVFVVSAFSVASYMDQASSDGADAFLSKPLDLDQFEALLQSSSDAPERP